MAEGCQYQADLQWGRFVRLDSIRTSYTFGGLATPAQTVILSGEEGADG